MLSRLMTRREQLLLVAVAGAICLGAGTLVFFKFARPELPHATPQREKAVAKGPISPAPEPAAPTADVPPTPPPPPPTPPAVAPAAPPAVEPKREVAVSLLGAVARPGVYVLEEGARITDLIERGGGLLEDADTGDINLVARLIDGTTLTIPVARRAVNDNGTLVMRGGQSGTALNIPQYTVQGWRPEASAPRAAAQAAEPPPEAKGTAAAQPKADTLIDINTASESQLESLPGIGPKLAHEIVLYREQNRFATVEDLNNVPGIGAKRLEALRGLVTAR